MSYRTSIVQPDPERQFPWLVRHFLKGLFDNDLIAASRADVNLTLIQILALITFPGALKSVYLFFKYGYYAHLPVAVRDLASLTDKCFFLSLSMILAGLVTVIEWDGLFPDRRDYQILTPWPIQARTIFKAKAAALFQFLLLFTLAVNAVPAVLFPLGVLAKRTTLFECGRYLLSHALSILAGNTFVFLFTIALQGMLLSLFPSRIASAITRTARFLLLLVLLCALLSFIGVPPADVLLKNRDIFIYCYPPMWFLGVYEFLLGKADRVLRELASIGAGALMLAGTMTAAVYALNYRRFIRRNLESRPGTSRAAVGSKNVLDAILNRCLLRNPIERASFHFVLETLHRSPRHALYLGSFVAAGVAVAILQLSTILYGEGQRVVALIDQALLSVPLILSFFVLLGVRTVFAAPVELEANWVFKMAAGCAVKSSWAGVRKAVLSFAIAPLFVLLVPFYLLLWDGRMVLLHLSFGVIMSLGLMDILLTDLRMIPFTCAYPPGKANFKMLWPVYLFGFTTYAFTTTILESWMLRRPVRFVVFFGLAIALLGALALRRSQYFKLGFKFMFEEEPREAPQLLKLIE